MYYQTIYLFILWAWTSARLSGFKHLYGEGQFMLYEKDPLLVLTCFRLNSYRVRRTSEVLMYYMNQLSRCQTPRENNARQFFFVIRLWGERRLHFGNMGARVYARKDKASVRNSIPFLRNRPCKPRGVYWIEQERTNSNIQNLLRWK